MKRLSLLLFILLTATGLLQAAEKYQIQAGVYKNIGDYSLNTVQSGLSNASFIMGYQAGVLQEQGPILMPLMTYSYGLSYYRMQGGGSTFILTDGYEAVVEVFYGDKKRVVQKRPFWEKLWYRGGFRSGLYYWVMTDKSTSSFSETGTGSYYTGSGLTTSMYVAVGLGRLGSLEYTYRSLISSGVDDSTLDHGYIAYVQQWDF